MSGTRRQRDTLAPSLFPFLAVLLCTMGALVLILMLIVAGAQTAAKEVAEENEQKIEEAEELLEHTKSAYTEQLEEGRIALEKKRLILQHLEDHIQELLDELADLRRTAELVKEDKQQDADEEQKRKQAISELEKQLADATQELETKLKKPEGDKPIFAIIPYQGSNGTHRRPIYLECTEDGLIIQPEGIRLTKEDLEPPYGPGNPLDAALRTIRAEFPPSNGAVTSTAYPLLVVRPSGIRTYTLARAAMSGWDDQFGYELINEDLELAFPESTAGLDSKLTKALELARDRQAALVMAMPNKYPRGSYRDFGPGSTSNEMGQGNVSGGRSEFGPGVGNAGESVASAQRSNATGGRGGYSLFSDPPSLQGGLAGDNHAGAGFAGGGSQRTQGSEAQRAGERTGFGDPMGEDYASRSGSSGLRPAGSLASGDSNSGDLGVGDFETGEFWTEANAGSIDGGSGSSRRGTASGGSAGQASSSMAGGANAASAMGQAGQQFELPFGSPGGSSGGSQSGQTQSSAQAASSQGKPSSAASMGSASNAVSASEQASMSPQLSLNRDFSKNKEPAEPVARARGRDWAWSQGPRNATPVVRSIRVQCLNDRWRVLPDSGSPLAPTEIPFDASPKERAEQLARVVLDRVDSWGLALMGGYWKPILVVDVAPDAQWRYEQLQQLLQGSGLEVQRRAERNAPLRR